MRLNGLDLVLAVMIAAMSMLWAALSDPIPVIGMLFALPLVFVLPGYTLTEAMFHKRRIETSHRLLLTLALSLAIDILSGFILNLLPGGLQAVSWAILLGTVTVVFALLATFCSFCRCRQGKGVWRLGHAAAHAGKGGSGESEGSGVQARTTPAQTRKGSQKSPDILKFLQVSAREGCGGEGSDTSTNKAPAREGRGGVGSGASTNQLRRGRDLKSAAHPLIHLGAIYQGKNRTATSAPGTRINKGHLSTLHPHIVPLRDFVLFGLAILVAVLSIRYSVIGVSHQPYPVSGTQRSALRFTQLWLLPVATLSGGRGAIALTDRGTVSNVSRFIVGVQDGNSCIVRIGVRSFEATTETYRVVMRMNGARVRTWPVVVLAPQQEWDEVVPVMPTMAGDVYVEVRLYRIDQPKVVYREVHVMLKAVTSRLWVRSRSEMLFCEPL